MKPTANIPPQPARAAQASAVDQPPIARSMSALDFGLLIILSILWGGSFFFVEVIGSAFPPFTVVAIRVTGAAVVLLLLLRLLGHPFPIRRELLICFLVLGLINNVIPFSLFVWAQSHIASGVASILNATTPLSTAVICHFVLSDEKLSPGRLAGVALGLAGVAVMMGATALASLGDQLAAQAACLGAALSYGFAAVFGRRFRRMGIKPLATAAGQTTASSLLLLPIVLIVDQPWTLPTPAPEQIAALAGLAVLSTAVAYLLYFRILASAGATNVALVTFLVPVSAILLGILVLGEVLEVHHMAGMALIAAGLVAMDGRVAGRIFGGKKAPD